MRVLNIGTIINKKYKIISILGRGSFGVAYKVMDLKSNMNMVIKEFLPSSLSISRDENDALILDSYDDLELFDLGVERFKKEAKALASCNHPNIVKISDYFSENRTHYFVMPFMEGITLKEYLLKNKTYPIKYIESLFISLANGLKYIHKFNIIHRDIKPENIFVEKTGNVILIDFGAARQKIGQKSQDFTRILTPGFAPPEQYLTSSSKQGPWTDIYALAATMYKVISGNNVPNSIDRQSDLFDNKKDPMVVLKNIKGLNIKFLNSISKALSIDIKDRYKNINEWINDIYQIEEKKDLLPLGYILNQRFEIKEVINEDKICIHYK